MAISVEELKENGYQGFKTIHELSENAECVMTDQGVYLVLRLANGEPEFVYPGTCGHFKNREPNVPISKLEEKWVGDSNILYIGKAKSLRQRLSQYMRIGRGEKVGHWGGRYIWQLKDAQDLVVCWKKTTEDSEKVECEMIQRFKEEHGKLPFANLRGGNLLKFLQ